MVKNYFIFSILFVALSTMILLINLNYSNSFGIADSSFNVKIIHPYKNDTLSNKENILVKGISTYNSSLDCSVSLIVNNKKPYSLVTPKGNNGTGDYTKWEFVIDKNVQKDKLIDGINKITAKNYCLKPMYSAFYSIFFNLSSTMDISNQGDVKGAHIAAANASTSATTITTTPSPSSPANASTSATTTTTTTPSPSSPANAPTKILCCSNLSNGDDNDDTGGYDNNQSSIETEKTTNSLAKEILLQIDYLYANDDGSGLLADDDGTQHGNDDGSGLLADDDGTQHGNDDGDDGEDLHDIKNTIENALS